jgi:hypothetical protein
MSRSLHSNGSARYNNVTHISIARQLVSIHVPANTQQLELCSLWTVLQLIARKHNTRQAKMVFSMASVPRQYNEESLAVEAGATNDRA